MRKALLPIFAIFFTGFSPSTRALVNIETVLVGDAGNAADTNGFGAVSYEYRIGKYEITIGQYVAFLNRAAKSDPYGLYDGRMASDLNVAGIQRSGTSGSYVYSVVGPFGLTPVGAGSPSNRPIAYIDWFDAARFANWMHNRMTNGNSTETGAYTLYGATNGAAPARNANAKWWVPSENEWHKAAYYKGGGTDAGYWLYPTQSDEAPSNFIGSTPNQANYETTNGLTVTRQPGYLGGGVGPLDANQNYLTEVGAFTGSASPYGTFDQGGNVQEWTDTGSAGLRGGSWVGDSNPLRSSHRFTFSPSHASPHWGARLAEAHTTTPPFPTPTPTPTPSPVPADPYANFTMRVELPDGSVPEDEMFFTGEQVKITTELSHSNSVIYESFYRSGRGGVDIEWRGGVFNGGSYDTTGQKSFATTLDLLDQGGYEVSVGGMYALRFTNQFGEYFGTYQIRGLSKTVRVIDSLEKAASLAPFNRATITNWSAGGSSAWQREVASSRDGIESTRAATADGESTWRQYTLTGPAVIDFWWKVSSEQGYDTFSYSVNGINQQTISGEVDWTYRTLTLPEGTHTIRWTYTKDESGAVGQDAGWLDDFAVYPATATLEVRDGATPLAGNVEINFGSGGGQDPLTKSLTFVNTSYLPLSIDLSLPVDAPFTFSNGSRELSLALNRQEQTSVTLLMPVSSAGPKSATLTISAPDSTAEPPTIHLMGTVVGGEIQVAQGGNQLISGQLSPVDLGIAPREMEFTITNNGNVADLVISQLSATGNFQITQQPATTVAVGGSTTFKVLALDSQRGLQQGSISIASNDEDTPVFTIPIVAKAFFGLGATTPNESVATGGSLASGWDFSQTTLPNGSTGSALKTGATQDNGQSYLEAGFSSRGLVSWNWKVSAQEGFDWLICEVNGNEVAGISTKSAAWQSQVVEIAAGASVRWSYRKDGSASIGEDAGYLADVTFHALDSNPTGYANWQHSTIYSDPLRRMSKSGMKAMFAWLGDFDPSHGPDADHHVPFLADGRLKLRFPISKSADGSQTIRFSSDLGSWTRRGMGQRIINEDGRRFVVEATSPPNTTKGFFKVSGGGDTAGIMVTVRGGTLGSQSVGDFRIGRTEVTSEEWQEVRQWALANGYTDLVQGSFNIGPWPVNNVSLEQAAKWCNARSEKEGLAPVYKIGGSVYRVGQMQANPITTADPAANGYRLPTEAEWEWAARGGLLSRGYTYSGSNVLGDVAWHRANASGPNAVATKLPNELGIYDMSGNVWEWCWGANAPARGGSWFDNNGSVDLVTYMSESFGNSWFGFRVARNAEN